MLAQSTSKRSSRLDVSVNDASYFSSSTLSKTPSFQSEFDDLKFLELVRSLTIAIHSAIPAESSCAIPDRESAR